MALNQKHNPTLRDLVKVDALPDNLGFLKDTLGNILDKFYYDKLKAFKSPSGHSASFNLDVITHKKIVVLEVPGTGIALVINPPDPQSLQGGSVFNVSLDYQVEILKYLSNFKLLAFDFSVDGFVRILTNIYGVSKQEFVKETINELFGDIDNPPLGADPLLDFVAQYNNSNSPPIDTFVDLDDIISQIEVQNDVLAVIVEDFLLNDFGKLKGVFAVFIGPVAEERLLELLIPKIKVAINDLSLGLEFPRSVLIPLDVNDDPLPEPAQSLIRITLGSVIYSTEDGLKFDKDLTFDFPKSEILGTGMTLEVIDLKLDLSRTTNIPEATLDGRPPNFIGAYVADATIGFPSFWSKSGGNAEIFGRNLLIGTGGISGTIGMESTDGNPPLLETTFGDSGFSIGLDGFEITFQQNSIIKSEIHGFLTLPLGFTQPDPVDPMVEIPAVLEVDINIADGDFVITASPAGGKKFTKEKVVEITVTTLSIGKEGDRFFILIAGQLQFLTEGGVGKFIKDPIDIQKLAIWSDGSMEFVGGASIVLPKPVGLKLGPAEVSITAIHLGAHEGLVENDDTLGVFDVRKYVYFGFDGGISLDPGGVDARGDGIKFYFTVDNDDTIGFGPDNFLRIGSMRIDLIVPGTANEDTAVLLASGFLSMNNTPTGQEYIGGIDFTLPKLDIGGSASMSMRPKVPSFLVKIGITTPLGIPIGPTGLSIYGFDGLFGSRYVASQKHIDVPEGADGWYPYYKKKVAPEFKEGITVAKFAVQEGLSVGAGVSIGTAADSGKAFAAKVFLLLSIPDVFIIQGQAQLNKGLIKLTDTNDPPFSMFIAITKEYVAATFGLTYDLKENEKIMTIDAELAMAFFFKDASAWYINLGTDAKPVTARIGKLFNAFAFLMVSGSGISTGAGITFQSKEYKAGPLKAQLSAYFEAFARINFKPRQFGGTISLGGSVVLSIFKFGFNITVGASLKAELSKPFLITGNVKVCIPIRFLKKKDYCASFAFTWAFDKTPNVLEIPLHSEAEGAKAMNMVTKETYALHSIPPTTSSATPSGAFVTDANDHVIPLDSWVNFEFLKSVLGTGASNIGGTTVASIDHVPQKKGKLPQIRHDFSVDEVNIFYRDGGSWVMYDVYGALSSLDGLLTSADGTITVTQPTPARDGFWQKADGQNKVNKLSIMAQSPLTWTKFGNQPPPDINAFGVFPTNIYCPPEAIEKDCMNLVDFGPSSILDGQLNFHDKVFFRIIGEDGSIENIPNPFGIGSALVLLPKTKLELFFTEHMACVKLKLLTATDEVTVSYYEEIHNETVEDINDIPMLQFVLIREDTLTLETLVVPVIYEDGTRPVDKIVIEVGPCKSDCDLEAILGGRRIIKGGIDTLVDTTKTGIRNTEDFVNLQSNNLSLVGGQEASGLSSGVSKNMSDLDRNISSLSAIVRNTASGLLGSIDDCLKYCNLTQEALDLEGLLDALAGSGSLTSTEVVGGSVVNLLQNPYTSVYTSLLQSHIPHGTHNYWTYSDPDATGSNYLNAYIGLDGSDVCAISLEFIESEDSSSLPGGGRTQTAFTAPFGFNDILGFFDIRIDKLNLTACENFTFLITAFGPGDKIALLRGTLDCYPASCCCSTGKDYLPDLCEHINNLILTLQDQVSSGNNTITRFQGTLSGLLAANDPTAVLYQTQIDGFQTQIADLQAEIAQLQSFIDTECSSLSAPTALDCGDEAIPCAAFFFELCWLSAADFTYNENLVSTEDVFWDTQAMVEGYSKSLQPIWRPNTTYLIQIKTTDKGSGHSTAAEKVNYFNYGFKTGGPLGHFHLDQANVPGKSKNPYGLLFDQDREDEFKLAKLSYYINFERSYPNADGKLLNSKPLFYDCPRLLLFFTHPQVYTMYNDFGGLGTLPALTSSLEVLILDPSQPDALPLPTVTWNANIFGTQGQDVTVLNQMVNGENCVGVTPFDSLGTNMDIEACGLEPLKVYTALYNANFEGVSNEVHRYPFQTSSYANFTEQVESYLFIDENENVINQAIFDLEKQFSAQEVIDATALVDGTFADLFTEFAHIYDRLIDGVFKLEAIAPAETTDFTTIIDGTTDTILGILIRNPEPFNDPKLSGSDLDGTIKVVTDITGTTVNNDFQTIFSKDGSKIFLTKIDNVSNSLDIGTSPLFIRFQYVEFDGDAYVLKEEVVTEVSIISPTTKLINTDCGRTEVGVNETLEAILIPGVTAYEFEVEDVATTFTSFYTRSSPDGKLPLLELSSLIMYNAVFDIRVRPLITGRVTKFEDVCQISTKVLRYVIIDPVDTIQNVAATVRVELQDGGGLIVTDYPGDVTLATTGPPANSGFGGGLVEMVNGVGIIEINDAVQQTVPLSLVDTEGTGINVDSAEDVIFGFGGAVEYVIVEPPDGTQGDTVTVTIEARNSLGGIDFTFGTNVTLLVSGDAIVPNLGVVDIVNGVGTIDVSDNTVETVTLTLDDHLSTGLTINVPPLPNIEFAPIMADRIVILDPVDGEQFTPVQVTVHALNSLGGLDINFNDSVKLEATLNATVVNAGVVNIVNGVGTIDVDNNSAQTVILSLKDDFGTLLDVSSTQDLVFAVETAKQIVILDPLDGAQNVPVKVTVQAQNSAGILDPTFQLAVTLEVRVGSATVPGGGIINLVNGVGMIQVTDAFAETVTLGLADHFPTNLDVGSEQDLVFALEPTEVAFEDLFTETADETLAQHQPDLGDSWTQLIQVASGTLKVDASNDTVMGGVIGSGTGVLYTANIDAIQPGYLNADYHVEALQIAGGAQDDVNILAVRILDADNMYAVRFNKAACELYKKSAGTWMSFGVVGPGIEDNSVVKLEMIGSTLRFIENYDELLSATDTDIILPGKGGVGMGAVILTGDDIQLMQLDNFRVRLDGDSLRVFLDKFTETVITALDAHSPDEGQSWTQVINIGTPQPSDGIRVSGGIAERAASSPKNKKGSFYTANITGGYDSPNYEVELRIITRGMQDDTIAIGVRVQNGGTDGYFVRLSGTPMKSGLYKRSGGTWSQMGAPGFSLSNDSIVRLRIVDDTITFLENENVIFTATDSQFSAAGEAGLGIGAVMVSDDDETVQQVDDFVVRLL